jgi:predicted ATPase
MQVGMLTRLKIKGFKSLVDVDVTFGPFTCIAGANGVGKSNLFDAITFISALAEKTLLEAALSVRADSARAGDIRSIFQHTGNGWGSEISFDIDMLVPPEGIDDLGQRAKATSTFLRYSLTIVREDEEPGGSGRLRIQREELIHIKIEDARRLLAFASGPWQTSILARGRRTTPFISTSQSQRGQTIVRLHSEGGKKNRPKEYAAADLPRTVLSSANAVESPTALLARREMQSWRLLQLEPSALRAPDSFAAASRIGSNGAHMPATVARLAHIHKRTAGAANGTIYARIANRLASLVDAVRAVRIDADEKREILSVVVTDKSGTEHEARALSDGTLRFLALAVLANDPEVVGLLCLEEPENGIHPDRISAMLRLLRDLAVNPREEVGEENPLRQVIVNTHSPAVVATCQDADLLVAASEPTKTNNGVADATTFRWLSGNWRGRLPDNKGIRPVARASLMAYLSLPAPEPMEADEDPPADATRVMDRSDLQILLPFPAAVHE